MSSRGRKVLDGLVDPLHERLVALPAADLRAARLELERLSETNCGWFLYRCRTLLADAIDDWLLDRSASVACASCKKPDARVRANGELVCSCKARRVLGPDQLAALDAEADRRWCK